MISREISPGVYECGSLLGTPEMPPAAGGPGWPSGTALRVCGHHYSGEPHQTYRDVHSFTEAVAEEESSRREQEAVRSRKSTSLSAGLQEQDRVVAQATREFLAQVRASPEQIEISRTWLPPATVLGRSFGKKGTWTGDYVTAYSIWRDVSHNDIHTDSHVYVSTAGKIMIRLFGTRADLSCPNKCVKHEVSAGFMYWRAENDGVCRLPCHVPYASAPPEPGLPSLAEEVPMTTSWFLRCLATSL